MNLPNQLGSLKYGIYVALSIQICVFHSIFGEISVAGQDDKYWYDKAYQSLQRGERLHGARCENLQTRSKNLFDEKSNGKRNRQPKPYAKNTILIIGDGMGLSTLVAARILKGQKAGRPGEDTYLSWENFPRIAVARTYNTDHQVPDSAGTATAIFCGVKTKMGVVGLNDSCEYQNCETSKESRVECISDWFIQANKSVGLVTNTRITHATPASLYGKSVDRNYESDADWAANNITITPEKVAKGCVDIASQLVNNFPGKAFKVIMGGGWGKFLRTNETQWHQDTLSANSKTDNDESNRFRKHSEFGRNKRYYGIEYDSSDAFREKNCPPNKICKDQFTTLGNLRIKKEPENRMVLQNPLDNVSSKYLQGERQDTNLIEDWIKMHDSQGHKHRFISHQDQLKSIDTIETDYLLGLFDNSHFAYVTEKKPEAEAQPTLTEMTLKAIDILEKDPNGYLLVVEGGRIDHANHQNLARYALEETISLDNVVESILERLSRGRKSRDTLLIVTTDHSHMLSLGGYPIRGNPILGLMRESKHMPYNVSDIDGMPFTSLLYGTGPGAVNSSRANRRQNLTEIDTADPNFEFPAAVPLFEGTHGGEDVPIYATGPGSHLIYGVQEQSYIAHAISYATCIGPYAENQCRKC